MSDETPKTPPKPRFKIMVGILLVPSYLCILGCLFTCMYTYKIGLTDPHPFYKVPLAFGAGAAIVAILLSLVIWWAARDPHGKWVCCEALILLAIALAGLLLLPETPELQLPFYPFSS